MNSIHQYSSVHRMSDVSYKTNQSAFYRFNGLSILAKTDLYSLTACNSRDFRETICPILNCEYDFKSRLGIYTSALLGRSNKGLFRCALAM